MIYKYEIINKKTDYKRPLFDKNRGLIIFRLNAMYHYYLEARRLNENGIIDYYILLSSDKFDNNCKKLIMDNYGRYKIYPGQELKVHLYNITKETNNINIDVIEYGDSYDAYSIKEIP